MTLSRSAAHNLPIYQSVVEPRAPASTEGSRSVWQDRILPAKLLPAHGLLSRMLWIRSDYVKRSSLDPERRDVSPLKVPVIPCGGSSAQATHPHPAPAAWLQTCAYELHLRSCIFMSCCYVDA